MPKDKVTKPKTIRKKSPPSKSAEPTVEEETQIQEEETKVSSKKRNGAIHDRYENIKKGELHITALQKMTISELIETAKGEGVQEYSGMKKQDLIFKILKERVNQDGIMFGEGVLEVLPDG
ncbi:MAG: Rho termination factor N-terminal domain-containing protein, partial [Planctomycetes bacterium]|nr:Rho termination factor N-terminal domain-containing protein [Planctomycetota bacterium]